MKRLTRRVPELSRESLVNPHREAYADRARAAGAIDLRSNFRLEALGGGYNRVVPLDPKRQFKS